jgi:hypothetical protein
MTVEVREVRGRREAEAFLRLPSRLSPEWSQGLLWEARQLFDPRRHRFHESHRVARFLALRAGRPVGRIAACLPTDGGPGPATFGALAVERDRRTLQALLGAAAGWLAAQGAPRMQGPLSLTINHEVGAQVAGFAGLPMLHMPRNPDWLGAMLEEAGLRPVQDVLACTLDIGVERHRARAARLLAARGAEAARLAIRPARLRHWGAEAALIARLYDDGWADNWGAVPMRPGEVASMASTLWPLLLSGAVLIAEWDGTPIGLCAIVPNLEEAVAPLGDGCCRLAGGPWRGRHSGGVGSARIPLLGVTRAFRGHPASALAVAALLAEAITRAERRGWRRVEVSWILAGNTAMRNAMARLPAPETGRWRIYESPPLRNHDQNSSVDESASYMA